VLLKCVGKQPVAKGWQKKTLADMTPEYLAKLNGGNIGVALGKASGGLCAIDIDDDRMVQGFLDLNPGLADTFRTHGARGCQFWIRVKGDYPPTRKLGDGAGEFRANGSQSIVWGIHPSGKPYEWVVNKPALEIPYDSLQWPDGLTLRTESLGQVPKDILSKDVSYKDVSYVTVGGVGGVGCVCPSASGISAESKAEIDSAVKDGARSSKQNNPAALKAVLTLLTLRNVETLNKMEQAERDYFADRWYLELHSLSRTRKSKSHYLRDIYDAIKNAKKYDSMNNDNLSKAWACAQASPLPLEAARFEGDTITQNLIALGWQLHLLHDGGCWPLGRDKAGRVMGLSQSQTRRDLDDSFSVVVTRSIFQIVKPYDKVRHLATEYRYVEQKKSQA
jgi:hypothetical protein